MGSFGQAGRDLLSPFEHLIIGAALDGILQIFENLIPFKVSDLSS